MKIKKINKMMKIRGTINNIFNRDAIYRIAIIVNSHSNAIDYLYEVICQQNKEIEELQEQVEKIKEILGDSERNIF